MNFTAIVLFTLFSSLSHADLLKQVRHVNVDLPMTPEQVDARLETMALPKEYNALLAYLRSTGTGACRIISVTEGRNERSTSTFFGRDDRGGEYQPIFSIRDGSTIQAYRDYFRTSLNWAKGEYSVKAKIISMVDSGMCAAFPAVEVNSSFELIPNELLLLMAYSGKLGECSITSDVKNIDGDGSTIRTYRMEKEKIALEYPTIVVTWAQRGTVDYYSYAERRFALLDPANWAPWATKIRTLQSAGRCFSMTAEASAATLD